MTVLCSSLAIGAFVAASLCGFRYKKKRKKKKNKEVKKKLSARIGRLAKWNQFWREDSIQTRTTYSGLVVQCE